MTEEKDNNIKDDKKSVKIMMIIMVIVMALIAAGSYLIINKISSYADSIIDEGLNVCSALRMI